MTDRCDVFERVFITVLRMDVFPQIKMELLFERGNVDRLTTPADQIHLNAGLFLDERCRMIERIKNKVSAQFAVNPRQQVFIKGCRHAGSVVVIRQLMD